MNNVSAIGLCACLFALGSFWSGLPPAVAAPAPGAVLADWTANGASACQKLLTPDFVKAIFVHVDGASQAKPDGQSCLFSAEYSGGFNSITIGLSDHVSLADWNRLVAENIPGAIPVPGVGDKAVRSKDSRALKAYKNGGRMCSVSLMSLGETPKLAGGVVAKKFGTLCNQLFGLP
jgi:hypothetical protein